MAETRRRLFTMKIPRFDRHPVPVGLTSQRVVIGLNVSTDARTLQNRSLPYCLQLYM